MSARAKKAGKSDGTPAKTLKEEHIENVSSEVDRVIREHGADEMGISYTQTYGPTMRALLHEYTQCSAVAEVNEDGEHPLFPMSRGETRSLRARHATGDVLGSSNDSDAGSRNDHRLLDSLLKSLDNDRLPQIKDQFFLKGNALGVEEFTSTLKGHIGHVAGADERQIKDELTKLHARLVVAGEDGIGEVDLSRDADGAEEGEGAENPEGHVSWSMFAKLLLDKGIVGDVVNNFNIVKVLSHIDYDKIAPLQVEFERRGNALSMEQFVVIMKAQFHYIFELTGLFDLHDCERQLIAQLVSLFEMIDINGNNTMSWEEFTAFLIDQYMTEDVQFNTIRFSDSKVRDDTVHQSYCEHAVYFKGYDKVAFVEQGSKSLKICTPEMQFFHEIKDFAQTPLCAEYIDKFMYVVVACSDLTLSFYDAETKMKNFRRITTKTAQLVMCWSEVAQVLFSADHEGKILAWDMQKVRTGTGRNPEPGQGDTQKDFIMEEIEKDGRGYKEMRHMEFDENSLDVRTPTPQSGRRSLRNAKSKVSSGPRYSGGTGRDIVMMLLELPVLAQMASCGVDRNVIIWDVFTGARRRTLKGHDMGVRCMAFVTATKFLVTGGYDYKLFVWNPYVQGKWIHAMPGHPAPIVGIEVIGTNQVVSADTEGFMKTWDLGTFQCLQTIIVDEILTLRAFVSIPTHKRVFAVDRKFIAYDYQNTGVADQTDEGPIIKALYHPRLKVFITGCTTHLRIWDAVTGAIKCVIPHREADITDFCVDDRGRKVFIADHNGEVFVHNSETGSRIKKLIPHDKEISGLVYCTGDKNIITVSWDRSIVVHDESEQTPKVWRKALNVHNDDISCIAFSRHLGLIATGSPDCVIAVREYERLRTLKCLLGHKVDITALAFVDPFALLVSADFGGNVAVWSVQAPTGPQHRFLNQVLTRFVNMQSLESSAPVNCVDPVYDAGEGNFTLYTGDEDGNVSVWDMSKLLTVAEIEPCAPKADWDPRKKDQIDAAHTTEQKARQAMAIETLELEIMIDKPVVRQVRSWRAHTDSVRTLNVYGKPPCIVTAGYDHMVKIWSLEGQMMTLLRAYGQIPWSFPVRADMIGIDDETLNAVLERVKKLESEPKKSLKGKTPSTFTPQSEAARHKNKLKELESKRQATFLTQLQKGAEI
mmetsp:Transcript_100313/g.284167  ORF Transcript_100313/g.284167 Transcript_100313/m.284167 type:complete len:1154 (+) Transcript_100313:239-3700(+)